MIRITLASASLIALAACATETPSAPAAPVVDPAPTAGAPADISEFALAMDTADILVEGGNEQAAIDRLTQLMGRPDLSETELATALFRRGEIRYGDGNDVFGAISDFDEMLALAPDHPAAQRAMALRDTARGEATSLNFQLETGDLSRTERFNTLFRLGQHQRALDLMLETGLTPDNAHLLDLYQMGYLCEGDEFTGPVYRVAEPDGTMRDLQYCAYGK
jgi:hypothetical protein